MKNVKITTLLLIAVCLMLGMVACSGKDKANDNKDDNSKHIDGVTICYQIKESNPSDDDVFLTLEKLRNRADAIYRDSEVEVYSEDDQIFIVFPEDTKDYDLNEIFRIFGLKGTLIVLDEENYDKWQSGKEYESVLTGDDIETATSCVDNSDYGTSFNVSITLNDEGTSRFADYTSNHIDEKTYIIFNNEVICEPIIVTEIYNGCVQITGFDTLDEAEGVAVALDSGELPLELSLKYIKQ